MTKKAIYPGTFDPMTYGHLDIIVRSRKIFDKIFLAIAENPQKNPLFNIQERILLAKKATKTLSNITVLGFNDLTINVVKKIKINIIIRGIRTASDLEHETQLAKINHHFNPEIETIFMVSAEKWAYTSSKLIKEIAQFGGKIDHFTPNFIAKILTKKLHNPQKYKNSFYKHNSKQ